MSGNIRRLEEAVVNRIAAGEVIQRPANALKEMLENCIDAKSTQIQVVVKQGGLKLLQIQDNGSGINREDFEIVCERFTTSKLREFTDLTSITTHGFRGEALASISHVAHLSITSRTKGSHCAYKASYHDGQVKGIIKPCAGNIGTQITVEDLFYNVDTRRKALKSGSEEHSKVSEVIGRYAIHNPKIGFSLKKHGESMSDIKTVVNSTSLDNIRSIYGPSVARDLLPVSSTKKQLGLDLNGLVSNPNYSQKKFVMLLFINNRLVDSSLLRKALESTYSPCLPKHRHPFIYLSIDLPPETVDVNVHPTKHEVHFLREEAIIAQIQTVVEDKLLSSNTSRTYFTQALLPQTSFSMVGTKRQSSEKPENAPYAHQMVRTDSKSQKLDSFLVPVLSVCSDRSEESDKNLKLCNNFVPQPLSSDDITSQIELTKINETKQKKTESSASRYSSHLTSSKRRIIKLESVLTLRDSVEKNNNDVLQELISNHTFVGCVSSGRTLLQHNTKLYLVNTKILSKELFYQIVLYNFGNFGVMCLSDPPLLYDLAMLSLEDPRSDWEESHGSKKDLSRYIQQFLTSKADMLNDYFSFEVGKNGQLLSIPLLLDNYIPCLNELPMLILRLATEVDWDSEEECFRTFAQELALFYSFQDYDDEIVIKQTEQILYPCLKKCLLPPHILGHDSSILEVADLHKLYKVFERC